MQCMGDMDIRDNIMKMIFGSISKKLGWGSFVSLS